MRPLRNLVRLLFVPALLAFAVPAAFAAEEYAAQRKELMEDIAALARTTSAETGRPAFDPRVMAVLGAVPRHRFVPAGELRSAYRNRPLPIGYGQTISQPYIVALMTDLMNLEPHHVVLEIGTGSGYQAAILAELAHDGVHASRSSSRSPARRPSACARWATPTCAPGSVTAITDGRNAAPSMRSWSPPRQATSRRRWCGN